MPIIESMVSLNKILPPSPLKITPQYPFGGDGGVDKWQHPPSIWITSLTYGTVRFVNVLFIQMSLNNHQRSIVHHHHYGLLPFLVHATSTKVHQYPRSHTIASLVAMYNLSSSGQPLDTAPHILGVLSSSFLKSSMLKGLLFMKKPLCLTYTISVS